MTESNEPAPTPHRLVVVGGGVAGLDIATRLAGQTAGDHPLAITLIDREPAYVWKPMLHTVAAGTSDAGAQETVFAAHALGHGFRFEFGEAVAIDRERRRVSLAALKIDGEEIAAARSIDYDTLVLAVGSRADDFGTPGVADHCARIDCRSDAIAFNERLRVELVKSVATGRPLTIGIVGGGATGVELAAELIETTATLEHYGAKDASENLRVVLIEAGPRLLGAFPEKVADEARHKLEQLGVMVQTGNRVTGVEAEGFVMAEGEPIAAQLMVWAAGVTAPPLLDTLDLERSRNGQLVVGATLSAPGDSRIYALGDCANPRLPNRDAPVPTTAQAASQQADYLCRHLPALIADGAAPPASYRDFGSLVSLGGYDAYGTLGRFGLFKGGFIRGKVAQLGHAMLYRRYQARLHGLGRGSLLWLTDTLNRRVRTRVKLS
ncbi:FAD-dependent oxidoreductase [Sphingomonas sp. PL-96]|uniref:NAD(P)/FAD-dependent oxidoreductase n=1 Tax=Sphingomonas sp. PL-96 TaxID=2887201 RepID=UPI001E55AB15|nr:FAD-dependent oxidoreductase [Sphingomonas sp. PL-96]MCC2978043.1 FAD-dependent oxidoreductase [Sphingomonas sp. PL-96]